MIPLAVEMRSSLYVVYVQKRGRGRQQWRKSSIFLTQWDTRLLCDTEHNRSRSWNSKECHVFKRKLCKNINTGMRKSLFHQFASWLSIVHKFPIFCLDCFFVRLRMWVRCPKNRTKKESRVEQFVEKEGKINLKFEQIVRVKDKRKSFIKSTLWLNATLTLSVCFILSTTRFFFFLFLSEEKFPSYQHKRRQQKVVD